MLFFSSFFFTPVCNTQVLVKRGELQFPNCQLEDANDTEQNQNFCDQLKFNDCQIYIPVEVKLGYI